MVSFGTSTQVCFQPVLVCVRADGKLSHEVAAAAVAAEVEAQQAAEDAELAPVLVLIPEARSTWAEVAACMTAVKGDISARTVERWLEKERKPINLIITRCPSWRLAAGFTAEQRKQVTAFEFQCRNLAEEALNV